MFSSHLFWRQSLWSRRDVCYTFAVYLEDYTCSVYFSAQLEPTEVIEEGVNRVEHKRLYCQYHSPHTHTLVSIFEAETEIFPTFLMHDAYCIGGEWETGCCLGVSTILGHFILPLLRLTLELLAR